MLRHTELIRNPDAGLNDLARAAAEESKRPLAVVGRDIKASRAWSLCELVHRSSVLDLVIVDSDQLVIRAGLNTKVSLFEVGADDYLPVSFDHQEFLARVRTLIKRRKGI